MIKMMRYFTRLAVSLVLMACCVFTASALDKSYYADNSVLASGKWVKIGVSESGIYQITADDIRRWGLGSDLTQIHVFGYGGKPLSEMMLGDNYADDLPQVPVVRTGDRILFYAQGPVSWQFFAGDMGHVYYPSDIEHLQVQHPYARTACYLVTNDSRFKDIEITKATNRPTGDVVTTYTERLYHELENINPGETGRNFLGEDFKSNRRQLFKFNLDGLVSGSQVKSYTLFGAYVPSVYSTITHSINGAALPVTRTDSIRQIGKAAHVHYFINGDRTGNSNIRNGSVKTFTLNGTTELNYGLDFGCSGEVGLARLDFITINYERQLALRGKQLTFGLNDASAGKSYRVSECGSATHVWDVTSPYALVELNAVAGDGTVTFSPMKDGRQEFVVFDESGSFLDPEYLDEVPNQDIHGEPTPDMIILAPSAYLEQAYRLADLHEEFDRFRVLVLDHEKVFNEFSSGTQDAMAYRRLCKMFYDRGKSEDGHRLGYLLLLGCGSYDNRLIGTDANLLNYPHLLTWQSELSSDDNNSITTDDYFGVLQDGSGADNGYFQDVMDIAVGRMIVKNASEARAVVNKVVNYVSKPAYGAWKNQALHVADDENQGVHMEQDTMMIRYARANGGRDIVFNRVYIDAFNAVSAGGARTYPDARTKLFSTLKEGVLWWNYIGHASTQNWTGEGLMMRSDVETQLYYRHLPVLYAATCEYTRFDNTELSSGERIFLNPNGGAVAVLCPSRLAEITPNGVLTNEVGRRVFSPDENGRPRRVGDILRLAKNAISSSTDNKRRFFCFGDPAMRLAWASYTAQVETINGKPVDPNNMPSFRAREQVEFSGRILDMKGDPVPSFNGTVVSTLFGPEQKVSTHGYGDMGGTPLVYKDRPNRLAVKVDTVENGRFTVRVIIPTEVDNDPENKLPSLINLYAYDSRDTLEAKGSNSDFKIYGYNDAAVADTIGPNIIAMGLNDNNFVDGSDINESPLFLATVSDDSGVNFSSAGIGHSMSLTLDGTISYNDLASYYTAMFADKGTMGSISYQLNDLSSGPHTLRLRVWDVYNNVSEKTISFNVINGLAPEIADVYCAANPASIETSFYVKHNRPDAVVTVTIEVYDLMGRRVWSTTQSGRSDMYTSTPVTWDLTDVSGRRVPRGIYVYRAVITTDGIKEATKAKKLAVTGE